jgi:aminopeptidase N
MEKSWAYRQDQLPSTHPIVATIRDIEDVQVNFDGITYAKGGSVLKQLVAWVGEEAFFAGVHNYFQKHQWGNAVLSDFLEELEGTSGRNLTKWSALWLETAGVNTLRPHIDTNDQGVITRFDIEQTADPDWPTLRPHRVALGFYNQDDSGAIVRTHRFELDIDGPSTAVAEVVGLTRPDLIVLNDDDLAYAKIRLDEQSTRFAIEHLAAIQNPLARSLMWGGLWDATRDAETPPQDFVDLVLKNIGQESESTTVRTALGQVALTVRNYVAPERRVEAITNAADALWALAASAQAGSDNQFQLVKAFCGLAITDEHANTLAQLRSQELVLEGLVVDQDLEWELISGLALTGRITQRDIEAALALDNTSNGQQAAARARSLLPNTENKRAVFEELTGSTELPNALVRSLTIGFDVVNDPAVLEPLVGPYFSMLERIWNERTYKIAEYIVDGLFPGSLVSQSLVDAGEAWLAAHPDSPALRRLLQENLAGVKRALTVVEKDRSALSA